MTDDWQPNPGHMPVKPDVYVHIIVRGLEDAPAFTAYKAANLRWCQAGTFGDITRWRRAEDD